MLARAVAKENRYLVQWYDSFTSRGARMSCGLRGLTFSMLGLRL
jgi:hypothetical protein